MVVAVLGPLGGCGSPSDAPSSPDALRTYSDTDPPAGETIGPDLVVAEPASTRSERSRVIEELCAAFESFISKHGDYHERWPEDHHDAEFTEIVKTFAEGVDSAEVPAGDEPLFDTVNGRFNEAVAILEDMAVAIDQGQISRAERLHEQGMALLRPAALALVDYGATCMA